MAVDNKSFFEMSHLQELDDSLLPISLVKSEVGAEHSTKYDPLIGDSLQFQKIIARKSLSTGFAKDNPVHPSPCQTSQTFQ